MISLYTRTNDNQFYHWFIKKHSDTKVSVHWGRFEGSLQSKFIEGKADSIITTELRKKQLQGYQIIEGIVNVQVLDRILPIYKCNEYFNLPMKCQTFETNRMTYPAMVQPKLNGIRCTLRREDVIEGEGMFKSNIKRYVLRSKEGLEYVLPHITDSLLPTYFSTSLGTETVYDGELYIHLKKLNYIRSCVPTRNKNGVVSQVSGNPLEVSFHIFDLSIPTISQKDRLLEFQSTNIFSNSNIHLVASKLVYNDDEVREFRDLCISKGYEGCVVRNIEAEYEFGKRSWNVLKYKKWEDAEFEVIDIISKEREPDMPLFVLKNDINDYTFTSNPASSDSDNPLKKAEAREILKNKDKYIGKMVTVRFYERSGVKQVPFHQNVLIVRDYE